MACCVSLCRLLYRSDKRLLNKATRKRVSIQVVLILQTQINLATHLHRTSDYVSHGSSTCSFKIMKQDELHVDVPK